MTPQNRDFDRLRLKNVRCFRDAEIPLDKRMTVIVGENASGKTTLMEALASLGQGDDEGLTEFPLRIGSGRGEIAIYESGRSSAVAKWDSKQPSRKRLSGDRYIFLYGRYRRVLSPESPVESRDLTDAEYLDELASHAAKSRTTTLTRPDNRLLQDLPGYLRGLYFGRSSDPRLDLLWSRLNAALQEMDSSLSRIVMEEGPYNISPDSTRNPERRSAGTHAVVGRLPGDPGYLIYWISCFVTPTCFLKEIRSLGGRWSASTKSICICIRAGREPYYRD